MNPETRRRDANNLALKLVPWMCESNDIPRGAGKHLLRAIVHSFLLKQNVIVKPTATRTILRVGIQEAVDALDSFHAFHVQLDAGSCP